MPLKATFEFERNGTMVIRFNQRIVNPFEPGKGRLLPSVNELNVTKELIDISLEALEDASDSLSKDFDVSLVDWQPNDIKLQFNFTNPEIASISKI